jgi:DNA (cytosine-5)-methyltransferase 1
MRTHIDLFSGIGGFALAARWNGIKTVQFVEIDPFCQKVLQKNFKGVPIWDDIKTFHYAPEDQWLEYAQNVGKAKSLLMSRIADRVTQNELPLGENKTSKDTEKVAENTARGKNKKSLPTTEGNAFVAENHKESSSQSTINTTMVMRNAENTNLKHGNLQSKEGCQTTIKSSVTTAIMQDHTTEPVLTKGVKNEPIFLLTAGVPCQPASCAGKRGGHNDDRWLWEETFRVIAEVKPRWCILENVAGLLSLEQGVVFDYLLTELENQGYETQTFCLPACAVNAPHRRDRVWIVAHQQQTESTGTYCGCIEDCHAPDTEAIYAQGCEGGQREMQSRGSSWGIPWIEVATRLCRVDDGLPQKLDRVNRLKALGNAIVPAVAFQIIKAICEVHR